MAKLGLREIKQFAQAHQQVSGSRDLDPGSLASESSVPDHKTILPLRLPARHSRITPGQIPRSGQIPTPSLVLKKESERPGKKQLG